MMTMMITKLWKKMVMVIEPLKIPKAMNVKKKDMKTYVCMGDQAKAKR